MRLLSSPSVPDAVPDVSDIEKDASRMTDFVSVVRTLQLFRPDLTLPDQARLLEIFGKVRTHPSNTLTALV